MERLKFDIQINATKKKVWDTMLQPETYVKWIQAGWPSSLYEGKWALGEEIKFYSPGEGGTVAKVTEFKPYDSVLCEHIAILEKDGSQDKTSEMTKTWVGTLERYTFNEQNGVTTLVITMDVFPSWAKMFDDDWPKALKKLKEISEA